MRHFCPRCEIPLPVNSHVCGSCNYQWVVACPACKKQNVAIARFCGGCGRGMTWQVRLGQTWDRYFGWTTSPNVKNMAAGFVFGGIMCFFAFGSMGMSNPALTRVETAMQAEKPERTFSSPSAKRAFDFLRHESARQAPDREATQADLVRIGNLILEAFSPAVNPDQWTTNRQKISDSQKYLQTLEQNVEDLGDIPLKRADTALFLFRLISDLFDVVPGDTMAYRYSDIPRYHYMNLPVETLRQIGLTLARENKVFGPDDRVTLAWLSGLSIDLVKTCEQRLKNKIFPVLQTAR